jgi:hypothetical protein
MLRPKEQRPELQNSNLTGRFFPDLTETGFIFKAARASVITEREL